MAISISDSGVVFVGGNLLDIISAVPTTGSYTAGDIILESTTSARISGWKRITTGSGHVLGTDWRYFSASPVLGTAVATTSGTSIDFTSIPSWVKKITVMFNGVSTNGTSNHQIQVGAGSVVTSGYVSSVCQGVSGTLATTGFITLLSPIAAGTYYGSLTLSLLTGNTYSATSTVGGNGGTTTAGGGSIVLGGTLDRIRLTTVNGTDTFDAGSVNILYE